MSKITEIKADITDLQTMTEVSLIGSYLYDPMSGVWTHLFLVTDSKQLKAVLEYGNVEQLSPKIVELVDY